MAAERLLREHALEAGLDPFFATVRAADRLAMLLDRLDELSLRRHEIRGNPAGLLARLLRRIDALKAERITPAGCATGPSDGSARRQGAAERERAAARARVRRALRRATTGCCASAAASTPATW